MVVYYPMHSSLYYAHNYIEKFNYESKSSKHSTLNKRDVEKAIKDAVKDINIKPSYPPKSNYKNSNFMNIHYYDYTPTITLFRQERLIEVFLRAYQEALDAKNLEGSNIIEEKSKQHDIGEAKDTAISQMQRNTRLLKAWGIYVGILGEAAMGGTPAAVKAYLVAAAAKGAIFTIAGAIFLPFLKAAESLLAVYMIIKVSTVAHDHYVVGTDPNNKNMPYGMLMELFDKIIEHDKNPTTKTDFTPYGGEVLPFKEGRGPFSVYPIYAATNIMERYKIKGILEGVDRLKRLIAWFDYTVYKLNNSTFSGNYNDDPSVNKLQSLLTYAKVKLKRANNINVMNSKEDNAKVLQASYWYSRIQFQKFQIFMTTKGISTYTKFLDRFLRTEFYLDFAKSSQDKTTRDKAKKESIYLSESFGSPNKGLNHASARAEFNFIIKATHKIPRLNYSWISSLIDIVFFKGIAKANHIEPSLRNMRSRVSIQQLKKENPKWHICDFFTYTNLEPSEQPYYRQENYKSCPFCYATIMAALRSKYGYTRYSMRTLGYGNYHEGTKAHKETLKILAEYSLTSKIKQRHTDYSHRGRFSNPVTKGGYIAQGTAYAFGLDPVMAFGPAWVHMAPSLTVTPVVTQALVGMAGGYAIADIFYAIAVYKIKKNSIKKAIAQVERVLQKIANHKPQGLSEYNLEIPGILAYNHAHAFELYEGLYRIITDGSLLPDSATELQKYLENLEKSIELCSRLIQEEKTLTDKKRLEISNDALFYIFQTCKHFNQLAQDFFFIGLMYQTVTFLTLGEHYYDKMAFGKEFYERTEDEKREFRKILDDAKIDSFTVSA